MLDSPFPLADAGEAVRALREALARQPDCGAGDVVGLLARHGLLDCFVAERADGGFDYVAPWRTVLECLAGVGGADLSTGRLLEGHFNALELIALLGTPEQQARALAEVRAGGLLGVWGADGAPPLRLVRKADGAAHLTGEKRYASGAGTIRLALVPVTEDGGAMTLLLLPVAGPERVDLSSWNHRGMRRTVSGTYNFQGIAVRPADIVGAPDDYRREPYFVGGIWRCAAAQLGSIEAITAGIARELAASGRDQAALQMARIGTAILRTRTARLWVEDAASRIAALGPDAAAATVEHAVALSAYARLATAEAASEVIAIAEHAVGLSSFAHGHPLEAATRDLSVYIRQANPDAVLLQHGRVLARDFAG